MVNVGFIQSALQLVNFYKRIDGDGNTARGAVLGGGAARLSIGDTARRIGKTSEAFSEVLYAAEELIEYGKTINQDNYSSRERKFKDLLGNFQGSLKKAFEENNVDGVKSFQNVEEVAGKLEQIGFSKDQGAAFAEFAKLVERFEEGGGSTDVADAKVTPDSSVRVAERTVVNAVSTEAEDSFSSSISSAYSGLISGGGSGDFTIIEGDGINGENGGSSVTVTLTQPGTETTSTGSEEELNVTLTASVTLFAVNETTGQFIFSSAEDLASDGNTKLNLFIANADGTNVTRITDSQEVSPQFVAAQFLNDGNSFFYAETTDSGDTLNINTISFSTTPGDFNNDTVTNITSFDLTQASVSNIVALEDGTGFAAIVDGALNLYDSGGNLDAFQPTNVASLDEGFALKASNSSYYYLGNDGNVYSTAYGQGNATTVATGFSVDSGTRFDISDTSAGYTAGTFVVAQSDGSFKVGDLSDGSQISTGSFLGNLTGDVSLALTDDDNIVVGARALDGSSNDSVQQVLVDNGTAGTAEVKNTAVDTFSPVLVGGDVEVTLTVTQTSSDIAGDRTVYDSITGDFNGDGFTDAYLATNDGLVFSAGNASGQLAAGTVYNAGTSYDALVYDPDSGSLAALTSSGDLQIFSVAGDGSISGTPDQTISGVTSGTSEEVVLTAADLDGDGNNDLVIAENGASSIKFVKNNTAVGPDELNYASTYSTDITSVGTVNSVRQAADGTLLISSSNGLYTLDVAANGSTSNLTTVSTGTEFLDAIEVGSAYVGVTAGTSNFEVFDSTTLSSLQTISTGKTGVTAAALASGELTGDATTDVAAIFDGDADLVVLAGDGASVEQAQFTLADTATGAGTGVSITTAGDLNGDGVDDLVTVAGDTVKTYLNNGSGVLSLTDTLVLTGRTISGVAISEDGTKVGVIDTLGEATIYDNANGTLTEEGTIFFGATGADIELRIKDFDSDGLNDVLAVASGGTGVEISSGLDGTNYAINPVGGSGSLFGGSATIHSITQADLDGDGTAELLVTSDDALNAQITILASNNDGTYSTVGSYGTGSSGSIVVNEDNNSVLFISGNDTVTELSYTGVDTNLSFVADINVSGLTIGNGHLHNGGDINGDGDDDVVALESGSATINTLFYSAAGGGSSFTLSDTITGGAQGYETLAFDINSDGNDDVIRYDATGAFYAISNGDGTFAPEISFFAGAVGALAIRADGAELALTTGGEIQRFEISGGVVNGTPIQTISDLAITGVTGQDSLAYADADGDIDGDLIYGTAGVGELRLYENTGASYSSTASTVVLASTVSSGGQSIAQGVGIGQSTDQILVSTDGGVFKVDFNLSSSGLIAGTESLASGPIATFYDNLGNLSLVGRESATNLRIFDGDGNGNLSQGVSLTTTVDTNRIRVKNFTGDNNSDIAVFGTGGFSIFEYNAGFGAEENFQNAVNFVSGDVTTSVNGFNGDSDFDAIGSVDSSFEVRAYTGSSGGGTNFSLETTSLTGGSVVAGGGQITAANFDTSTTGFDLIINTNNDYQLVTYNGSFSVSELTGISGTALTSGNFGGSAEIDLAVFNDATGKIQTFIGNGSGGFTFSDEVDALDPTVSKLAAYDVNEDGNLDILALSDGGVSVISGRGDGTLYDAAPPLGGAFSDILLSAGPENIDGNNDTKLNLIGPIMGGDDVQVLDIDYSAAGPYDVAPSQILTLANSDTFDGGTLAFQTGVNGDDIYLTTSGNVQRFTAVGDGTFNSAEELAGTSSVQLFDFGDFNNDGDFDLIAKTAAQELTVFTGNGTTSFSSGTTINTSSNIQAVSVGDFNSGTDTFDDIFVVGADALLTFLGNGDTTFQSEYSLSTGTINTAAIASNVDGNTQGPDVFVIDADIRSYGGNLQSVGGDPYSTSLQTTTLTNSDTFSVGNPGQSLIIQNFDGDGDVDIIANATTSARTFRNNGGGSLVEASLGFTSSGLALDGDANIYSINGTAVDVHTNSNGSYSYDESVEFGVTLSQVFIGADDVDALGDIVVTGSAGGVYTARDDGAGSYLSPITSEGAKVIGPAVLGPGNADSVPEVFGVVGSNLETFIGSSDAGPGDSFLSSANSIAVTGTLNITGRSSLAIGQVDAGADLDIVVALSSANIASFTNNGDDTFTQVDTGISESSVFTFGNFDGTNGLVVKTSGTGDTQYYSSDLDGTYTASGSSFNLGGNYSYITNGDLDADGNSDLVFTLSSGGIGISQGNGDATFRAATASDTGTIYDSVAIADINSTNPLDVFGFVAGDDTVKTLLGQETGNGAGTSVQGIEIGTFQAGGGAGGVAYLGEGVESISSNTLATINTNTIFQTQVDRAGLGDLGGEDATLAFFNGTTVGVITKADLLNDGQGAVDRLFVVELDQATQTLDVIKSVYTASAGETIRDVDVTTNGDSTPTITFVVDDNSTTSEFRAAEFDSTDFSTATQSNTLIASSSSGDFSATAVSDGNLAAGLKNDGSVVFYNLNNDTTNSVLSAGSAGGSIDFAGETLVFTDSGNNQIRSLDFADGSDSLVVDLGSTTISQLKGFDAAGANPAGVTAVTNNSEKEIQAFKVTNGEVIGEIDLASNATVSNLTASYNGNNLAISFAGTNGASNGVLNGSSTLVPGGGGQGGSSSTTQVFKRIVELGQSIANLKPGDIRSALDVQAVVATVETFVELLKEGLDSFQNFGDLLEEGGRLVGRLANIAANSKDEGALIKNTQRELRKASAYAQKVGDPTALFIQAAGAASTLNKKV